MDSRYNTHETTARLFIFLPCCSDPTSGCFGGCDVTHRGGRVPGYSRVGLGHPALTRPLHTAHCLRITSKSGTLSGAPLLPSYNNSAFLMDASPALSTPAPLTVSSHCLASTLARAGGGPGGPALVGGQDALAGALRVCALPGPPRHPADPQPLRRHRLVLQHGPHQHARAEPARGQSVCPFTRGPRRSAERAAGVPHVAPEHQRLWDVCFILPPVAS